MSAVDEELKCLRKAHMLLSKDMMELESRLLLLTKVDRVLYVIGALNMAAWLIFLLVYLV